MEEWVEGGAEPAEQKKRGRPSEPIDEKEYSKVIELYFKKGAGGRKPNILGISRDMGITREKVNKYISEYNRRNTEGLDDNR